MPRSLEPVILAGPGGPAIAQHLQKKYCRNYYAMILLIQDVRVPRPEKF